MSPIIVVGLVAGAGLLAAASAAKTKGPQKPGASNQPPPDLMAAAKAAYEASDPAQLRAIATKLEEAGFKAQADDFRAYAKKIEDAIKQGISVPPAPAPKDPIATGVITSAKPGGITSPGWPQPTNQTPVLQTTTTSTVELPQAPAVQVVDVITRAPETVSAQKLLAGKVALHLANTSRGRENKALVSSFQAANQPEAGKVDGLYGPKTALVLAKKYSIVPPKPFYWPRVNTTAAKRAYSTELMKLAMLDQARFDEWSMAAKV